MRILIVSLGSIGDLMPFLVVAEGLRTRGHSCAIASNAGYAQLVRMAGFEFTPIWDRAQQNLDDVLSRDPAGAWEQVREEMFRPATQPAFDFIADAARKGPCVILASWSAFGARLAHEKLKLPLASAYLSPHALDEHRGGVPIGFFPDWFCPPRPGWPRDLELAGFPLHPDALIPALPPPLETFLQDGPPPIVFTPGSFMRQAEDFFRESLAACEAMGARAIFLTPYRQQVPALPATVLHFPFVALQRLAPRCAALVCHGGIGTCAQGLRAGIPQLLAPVFYDQFDNAACVEALGAGRTIRDYERAAVAAQLRALLDDTAVKQNGAAIRARFDGADPVARICQRLEALA